MKKTIWVLGALSLLIFSPATGSDAGIFPHVREKTETTDQTSFQKKALLIGINQYKNLQVLNGPVNDVKAMKDTLMSCYGFQEDGLKVLTDAQATKKNIKRTFLEWLIEDTKENDLVFFYYSGHSTQFAAGNIKISALLPSDTEPNDGQNIICENELDDWLRQLKGRAVVVIIDSDFVRGGKSGSLYFPARFIYMVAAQGIEGAWDSKFSIDKNHGAFTYGLLEGMKTLKNPSYQELFDYVCMLNERLKLPQNPQLNGNPNYFSQPFLGGKIIKATR